MLDPRGPTCRAPQAPVTLNLVNGNRTYASAHLMRLAETEPRCGTDAAWFQPKPASPPKPEGPLNRIINFWKTR
jgi:hypothetical protein